MVNVPERPLVVILLINNNFFVQAAEKNDLLTGDTKEIT